MKIHKGTSKKKTGRAVWTRKDRKLLRLNLAIYQDQPAEPEQLQLHLFEQRKAS